MYERRLFAVLFRVTGRGGAISPHYFAMLLRPFEAMCSSQKMEA